MFLVKANTVIQVPVATSSLSLVRWRPYTTSEDKLYDKEQVWDAVAVHNGRDIPAWAVQNITEHGNVVLRIGTKFAMCKPSQLESLD